MEQEPKEEKEKLKRGFANMSDEEKKRICSMGGKASWAQGKAHRFTKEEARAAGLKGGKAHSPEHMKTIGRLGGLKRAEQLRSTSGIISASVRTLPLYEDEPSTQGDIA